MERDALTLHLVRALSRAQHEGRRHDLETLTRELGVRRTDVRGLVSALDREGYVDALRMRLTLRGFVLGRSLEGAALPPIRRAAAARRTIAAA
jgi:Mn-dependent DtxR family transcriptional regulator